MADAALSFPRFRSRLPWWGRDLQTLRNHIVSIEFLLGALSGGAGRMNPILRPPR